MQITHDRLTVLWPCCMILPPFLDCCLYDNHFSSILNLICCPNDINLRTKGVDFWNVPIIISILWNVPIIISISMFLFFKFVCFAASRGTQLYCWWALSANPLQRQWNLLNWYLPLLFLLVPWFSLIIRLHFNLQIVDPGGIANWSVTHVDWSEGKWHPRSYRAADVTDELLKNITVCFQHSKKENTFPLLFLYWFTGFTLCSLSLRIYMLQVMQR
jgi:hypothetical protein